MSYETAMAMAVSVVASVVMVVMVLVAVAVIMFMMVVVMSGFAAYSSFGLEFLHAAGMQGSRIGSGCLQTGMWECLDDGLEVFLGSLWRAGKRHDERGVSYTGYRSRHHGDYILLVLVFVTGSLGGAGDVQGVTARDVASMA